MITFVEIYDYIEGNIAIINEVLHFVWKFKKQNNDLLERYEKYNFENTLSWECISGTYDTLIYNWYNAVDTQCMECFTEIERTKDKRFLHPVIT